MGRARSAPTEFLAFLFNHVREGSPIFQLNRRLIDLVIGLVAGACHQRAAKPWVGLRS